MNSKRTYVGRVTKIEMGRSKFNQKELAVKCDISQAALCGILREDIRLAPATLAAITNCWPDETTNKRVLIAHLRDEIRRAKHDPEGAVIMNLPDGTRPETMASRDLDLLRSHMSDPDVATIVQHVAEILRRADKAKHIPPAARVWPGHAADPPASYDT